MAKQRVLVVGGGLAGLAATMKLADAFTRAGKPYDLIVLPEGNHGVFDLEPSRRRYWLQATRRHFERYLGLEVVE